MKQDTTFRAFEGFNDHQLQNKLYYWFNMGGSMNNFKDVCPSGNSMVDGFKEPEPKVKCWSCGTTRINDFPIDENGDEYCPDCNENQ